VQTSDTHTAGISSQGTPLKQSRDATMTLSKLFKQKSANDTADESLQQNSSIHASSQAPEGANKQKPQQNKQADNTEISAHEQTTMTQATDKPPAFDTALPPVHEADPLRSAQAKSKKIANQTAGDDAARSTDSVTTKAEYFDQVSLIDIETGSDNQTTAFDNDQAGGELLVSAPTQSNSRQLENNQLKVSQTSSGTLLSAEQRALVSRYFKQLEKNNETNE
jgi:hypothetical protein